MKLLTQREMLAEMFRLTDRQAETLEFLCVFLFEHGHPPTVREIGRALGLETTEGPMGQLRRMVRKGALARTASPVRRYLPRVRWIPASALDAEPARSVDSPPCDTAKQTTETAIPRAS